MKESPDDLFLVADDVDDWVISRSAVANAS